MPGLFFARLTLQLVSVAGKALDPDLDHGRNLARVNLGKITTRARGFRQGRLFVVISSYRLYHYCMTTHLVDNCLQPPQNSCIKGQTPNTCTGYLYEAVSILGSVLFCSHRWPSLWRTLLTQQGKRIPEIRFHSPTCTGSIHQTNPATPTNPPTHISRVIVSHRPNQMKDGVAGGSGLSGNGVLLLALISSGCEGPLGGVWGYTSARILRPLLAAGDSEPLEP